MTSNGFGNLNDWGVVLEKLDLLTQGGALDQWQEQLIRLLRFDQNWRLREAAIESLAFVKNPDLDLAREILLLIKRNDLYYDVRILAADAIEQLILKIIDNRQFDLDILQSFVREIIVEMEALLASPEPPKFHHALQNSVAGIRQAINRG
ncbi:hypothetical protein HRM2_05890 [Desulforapulum autotrophicum HRM2]|uniref:HEAT repeat domain-containing protein n=1 Tax=Desulforapulum autotrophicum (strain ATCC 43914 / DSM 3382 / VKM B-1955 / HRM2) TaxID=177437 RepID=C0QIR3_DESAH|nr:hypothetical protein [Desulforapulum autotrophicum]ACN13703.1 hypothetical protein HRM2_05890 [Desulforapulum autotrophicum HRM2]